MENFALIVMICVMTYTSGSSTTPPTDDMSREQQVNNSNNQQPLRQHSICGPETSEELVADVRNAYHKANNWLLSQRTENWAWPFISTATAMLSLQISNDSWYSRGTDDLAAQLSVKQLEIELLADLSRAKIVDKIDGHKTRTLPTISPGMLAYYIMALNSTCHDVTDFYKNDLVDMLTNHMKKFPQPNFNNHFQYSLALLALCESGAPIKKRFIRGILDGQTDDGNYRFGVDVVSMAVMAMVCVRDKVPEGYRNTYENKLKRSIDSILSNQNSDSTFGNHISTALAAQALAAAEKPGSNWNCQSAVRSVLDSQDADGGFGSQGGTIQILPFLTHKTFASVKDVQPNCDSNDDGKEPDSNDVPEIRITLIIENSVNTSVPNLDLSVVVPENSTLYEAMVLAMEQHPDYFSFEARFGQWGHFMSSINGISNDDVNYYYWTILIGFERTSATTGSDRIITQDEGIYVWYYKSFA